MKAFTSPLTELGQSEIDKWRVWRAADDAFCSPFLTPEFAIAYGNHCDRARVAIFEDAGEVVGFMPFEQYPLRVGKALAHGLADVQAAITAPGLDVSADQLIRTIGIEVFEFDRFVTQQAEQRKGVRYEASPVIDLSGGFEDWLAERKKVSKSRFKRILQRERQIERELGTSTFTFESDRIEDLEQLMAWKSDQYIRTGRRDRFASEWFTDFMIELFSHPTEDFSVVLSALAVGDRTLALDLGLKSGTTLAGWFPAYDSTLTTYSLGTVCLIKQLEEAAKSGITRFDLGPGEADYKNAFMTRADEVASGRIATPTPRAALRLAQIAPREAAHRIVLSRPELRKAARETLGVVGSVRKKVRDVGGRHAAMFPVAGIAESVPPGII